MPSPTIVASEPCFPSPVFTFKVEDADALNRALVADVLAYRQTSPGMQRSNQHGWHSDTDFFRRPEASFRALAQQIHVALASATRQVAPRLDLTNKAFSMQGWINVNERGAYNTPHTHPHHEWSGSYYVTVPPAQSGRSGAIEFLDPRGTVSQMDGLQSIHFAPKIRKMPVAGTMLIFPSYLRHWVYPNEQDDIRISIAFNGKLVNRPAPAPTPQA